MASRATARAAHTLKALAALALFAGAQAESLAAVLFPAGQSVQVVASPRSALEHQVLARLSDYCERVLGKKVEVVPRLAGAKGSRPVLVLLSGGRYAPLSLTAPLDSAEGFAVRSGKVAGRQVVA